MMYSFILKAKKSGEVEGIKIELSNRSSRSVDVTYNPDYYDGLILVVGNQENIFSLQDAKRYGAIRTGIMPMVDIRLRPGEVYSWTIKSKDFVGANGTPIKLDSRNIKSLLPISETIWRDNIGNVESPWVKEIRMSEK